MTNLLSSKLQYIYCTNTDERLQYSKHPATGVTKNTNCENQDGVLTFIRLSSCLHSNYRLNVNLKFPISYFISCQLLQYCKTICQSTKNKSLQRGCHLWCVFRNTLRMVLKVFAKPLQQFLHCFNAFYFHLLSFGLFLLHYSFLIYRRILQVTPMRIQKYDLTVSH